MALGFYEGQIQDTAGNAVTGTVEVRGWADNLLKSIYADRGGATALSNGFASGADGSFRFHATGGLYRVTTISASGTKEILVQIGLAQESDFQVLTAQGAWDVATTYETGDMVSRGGYLFASLIDANLANAPDDATPGDTAQWMLLPAVLEITGTSTTSLTPGAGAQVFATQSGRGWTLGQRLRAASADGTMFMTGLVTSYSGVSLTLDVDRWSGVSAHADWNISVDGEIGPQGQPGPVTDGSCVVCRLAELANVDLATGLQPAGSSDGVVRAEGDRIAVLGQTDPAENGFYLVPASGAAARDPSFATYDVHAGVIVSVQEGTSNAGYFFHCVSAAGGTIDVTALDFDRLVIGRRHVREVTGAGDITVGEFDDAILVNKAAGAATGVTLPAAAARRRPLTVKDTKGDAATNPITLNPDGAETIDGLSSWVIGIARGAVTIHPDPGGSGWNVL